MYEKNLIEYLYITQSNFDKIIKNKDRFYKIVNYIHKNKKRKLECPNIFLKNIQKYILKNILYKYQLPDYIHGFVKNKNIKTNAESHLNQKYILTIDIENFFHSIKYEDIFNIFNKNFKFKKEQAIKFAKLCTYKNYLPQGAPCSPYLSNIFFQEFDEKICLLTKKNNIIYTRYADDLTFSSNDFLFLERLYIEVKKLFKNSNLNLNLKKTRFLTKKNRMSITGLNINENKITVSNKYKRKLRAEIFNYYSKKIDDESKLNQILGKILFIKYIEPKFEKKIIQYIKKIKLKFGVNYENERY